MSKILKVLGLAVVVLVVVGALLFSGRAPEAMYQAIPGYFEDPDQLWAVDPFAPSVVTPAETPTSIVSERAKRQEKARSDLEIESEGVILFGDTHVHSTNSSDAFLFSLPALYGGEGAFPPSYACDYARFVSQLDFYFLTDHAEAYTPERWADAIDAVRQCDQTSGEEGQQDVIAFMGYEWTQSGETPETHFGHHNVLFKGLADDELPKRPIAVASKVVGSIAARDESSKLPVAVQIIDARHGDYYRSYNRLIEDMASTPNCDMDVPSPELPADCYERVATPGELYERLDQGGLDAIVIPHGMAWGIYTPPESNWSHQLNPANADMDKTRLIEVYSGHGNSEVYREQAERPLDENGKPYCAEPTATYLPACWQAGEIIRTRCLEEGLDDSTCDGRATEARQNFVDVESAKGFLTVPSASAQEWKDSGQARGAFLPAFHYRAKKSAQYGLALRNFDVEGEPLRYDWGFIASTDTHSARAAHGFKQFARLFVTDANGGRADFWIDLVVGKGPDPIAESNPISEIDIPNNIRSVEFERLGSFLSLGGVAAVHAIDRTRDGIWDAMKRKEVYGTSGPKILLWFDLLNGPDGETPMGSHVASAENPKFRVKAAGSFRQKPGCPDYVKEAMEANHLKKLSHGECYFPSDERYKIDRVEVIRIKPQNHEGEEVGPLIEDAWQVFECEPDPKGCVVEFEDPEYATAGRDTVYYVRALEEETPTVNAGNLRATYDDEGNVLETRPCYGDIRTDNKDDCLADAHQRAWSSPIYVDFESKEL